MPTLKWLVVARNEYRLHTSRIRKIRPYFPYLVIGLLAVYVFFIAPVFVSLFIGDFFSLFPPGAAIAMIVALVQIILFMIFFYFIILPITYTLKEVQSEHLEIFLAAPVKPGDVLLGEFLGQMPFYAIAVTVIAGFFTAVLNPLGLDMIQMTIIIFVFVITFFSALWIGTVIAALSEALQLGYLIGAILGGFFLQTLMKNIRRKHREDMVKVTKLIALGFIVPFFFAHVGLNFDLSTLFTNVNLLIITVAIAFFGKLIGSVIVEPLSNLNLKQLYYVGWAMNSRGAAELVIALIALQYGLIPLEIFSALVATSLITTLTFPPVLARGISKNPGLMDAKMK